MKWHGPRPQATCALILTSLSLRAGSPVRPPAFLPARECVQCAGMLQLEHPHSPSIDFRAVPCEALCDSDRRECAGQWHTATATLAVPADTCDALRESAARSPAADRRHAFD